MLIGKSIYPIIVLLLILTACNDQGRNISIHVDENVSISHIENGEYILTLHNNEGVLIEEMAVPVEPTTEKMDKDLYQITISLGSPNRYVYFFNSELGIISETYYNPILVNSQKVGYFKDNRTLMISDLFSKEMYYKEISRDFSPTAEPSSVIISAEIIKDKLHITYWEGKSFVEREEIIDL